MVTSINGRIERLEKLTQSGKRYVVLAWNDPGQAGGKAGATEGRRRDREPREVYVAGDPAGVEVVIVKLLVGVRWDDL